MVLNKIFNPRILVALFSLMAIGLPVQADVTKPQASDKAAIVNNVPIERAEFDGEVLQVQRSLLNAGKPLSCEQVASIRKEVIESMIQRELLFQESRKAGVKVEQSAIVKELDALKKQFPNEGEYKNELVRRNITEDTLRARLEQNLAVLQYIERQFAGKTTVADNDMVSYYENRLNLFKQPLQVRVSHILIQTDAAWDETHKQEARRKAEQALKNLKKGQDFAALAREQSDGPTRTLGGDLGFIKMGQLEKQLESVVFSLKPGELSELIETANGYHLFKMVEKKPETILAYDVVKEQIRQYLRQEKIKQEADQYAKSLREKGAVEILLKEEINLAKRP